MATDSEKSDSFQFVGKPTRFSHIRFVHIPETYTVGVDVLCSFEVTEDLTINPRDWIGLYKVGWRSSQDYFYYEWSPIPSNYVPGTKIANSVRFPGNVVVLRLHVGYSKHDCCLYNAMRGNRQIGYKIT